MKIVDIGDKIFERGNERSISYACMDRLSSLVREAVKSLCDSGSCAEFQIQRKSQYDLAVKIFECEITLVAISRVIHVIPTEISNVVSIAKHLPSERQINQAIITTGTGIVCLGRNLNEPKERNREYLTDWYREMTLHIQVLVHLIDNDILERARANVIEFESKFLSGD